MPPATSRSRPCRVLAALGAALAFGACDSGRGTPLPEYPGSETSTPGVVVGTVAAGDQPYVDALAANFVDGGRLVARLDETDAACVAERWIAVLDPAALRAADVAPDSMTSVTLDRLRSVVSLDAARAEALTASYDACGVDHTGAFLDSLLLTSQITDLQRVCLLERIPPGLVGEITVSALVDPEIGAALAAEYQRALDACPA